MDLGFRVRPNFEHLVYYLLGGSLCLILARVCLTHMSVHASWPLEFTGGSSQCSSEEEVARVLGRIMGVIGDGR